MLILSRRPGEAIEIGTDIKVTVLSVEGRQVRIGVDAPKTTPVHRDSVAKRIRAENGGQLVLHKRARAQA